MSCGQVLECRWSEYFKVEQIVNLFSDHLVLTGWSEVCVREAVERYGTDRQCLRAVSISLQLHPAEEAYFTLAHQFPHLLQADLCHLQWILFP